jgi:hypothetical protein
VGCGQGRSGGINVLGIVQKADLFRDGNLGTNRYADCVCAMSAIRVPAQPGQSRKHLGLDFAAGGSKGMRFSVQHKQEEVHLGFELKILNG